VAASLSASTGTLQNVLTMWPKHYQALLRTGSYGTFFNFFLCGVRLRFSPEGAEHPAMTPWMTSDAARCQR
jgi:phospholipid/cholesterol/gamma-HCH transport system substrate-binding protein